MKKSFLSNVTRASIVAVAASSFGGGAKADGTVPDFDYAATGTVSIGGNYLEEGRVSEREKEDVESGLLSYSGQFVIPVTGYWNIQLGGKGEAKFDLPLLFRQSSQFQASGIGFWRDRDVGTLGVELGLRSEGFDGRDDKFVKIGGLGEYYMDYVTVGGAAGALVPWQASARYETSYYGKAWLNYYVSDQIAVTGFGDWIEYPDKNDSRDLSSWRAGGKLRFKTSMAGTQAFVSGAYTQYEFRNNDPEIAEGVQIMGGVSINILGGQPEPDSLLDSDRIFGLDTSVYRLRLHD